MSKKIPEFRSEEEERAFWTERESVEGASPRAGRKAGTGGLKLPERAVFLRLPGALMEELRIQSQLMDVPQKSLIKTYLTERMEREMRKERSEGKKLQGGSEVT